jgi:hypothetical protein
MAKEKKTKQEKKASNRMRARRNKGQGVGRPAGVCGTWWNKNGGCING